MFSGRYGTLTIALVLTGFCLCVVLPAVMIVNDREDWALQIPFTGSLTVILALPISYILCWQGAQYANVAARLERLLSRDRLTDTATRDYFFSKMADQPENLGVSLMIDIDHFKRINDIHGHLVGDQVIRDVAATLRRFCRSDDIVCRFGGEEFVVFLSNADQGRGLEVAERMRRAVAENPIRVGVDDIAVTVSVGGSLKDTADTILTAIASADAALYRAKALGRNRTVLDWFAGRVISRDCALR